VLTAARCALLAGYAAVCVLWIWKWWAARLGRSESGRKVNPASMLGMVIEAAAFAVALGVRDPSGTLPGWIYGSAAVLHIVAAAFGWQAAVWLGREFRVQAVVTDTHRLITSGPYAVVRHPIYASLLGMVAATGVILSDGRSLLLALPIAVIGTEIRVRAEDRLLAAHFGPQFEAYRKRVRAYLPGVR
jgi:protein-S-isoprenylcysteine O-methyltransferase Ste14